MLVRKHHLVLIHELIGPEVMGDMQNDGYTNVAVCFKILSAATSETECHRQSAICRDQRHGHQ